MNGRFEHIKGGIDAVILRSLKNSDKYGYEISREIVENTYEIKPATLYAYLKRLENDGMISSYWGDESNGGRRKYYSLTEIGMMEYESYVANLSREHNDVTTASDTEWTVPKKHTLRKARGATKAISGQSFNAFSAASFEPVSVSQDSLSKEKNETHVTAKDIVADEFESRFTEVESLDISSDASTAPSVSSAAHRPEISPMLFEFGENATPDATFEPSAASVVAPASPAYKKQMTQDDLMDLFDRAAAENRERMRQLAEKEIDKDGKRTHSNPSASDPTRSTTSGIAGEDNYRYIMSSLIGGQLADPTLLRTSENKKQMQQPSAPQASIQALDEYSRILASNGIRMRVYDPNAAAYKPPVMLYLNKLRFFAFMLTFLITSVTVLGIWLGYRSFIDITVPMRIWVGLAVFPLFFGLIYLVKPAKKTRPRFIFRYVIINVIAATIIIFILIFALAVLYFRVVFTDTAAILTYIVLPCLVTLGIPIYALFYKLLYKSMLI